MLYRGYLRQIKPYMKNLDVIIERILGGEFGVILGYQAGLCILKVISGTEHNAIFAINLTASTLRWHFMTDDNYILLLAVFFQEISLPLRQRT